MEYDVRGGYGRREGRMYEWRGWTGGKDCRRVVHEGGKSVGARGRGKGGGRPSKNAWIRDSIGARTRMVIMSSYLGVRRDIVVGRERRRSSGTYNVPEALLVRREVWIPRWYSASVFCRYPAHLDVTQT